MSVFTEGFRSVPELFNGFNGCGKSVPGVFKGLHVCSREFQGVPQLFLQFQGRYREF